MILPSFGKLPLGSKHTSPRSLVMSRLPVMDIYLVPLDGDDSDNENSNSYEPVDKRENPEEGLLRRESEREAANFVAWLARAAMEFSGLEVGTPEGPFDYDQWIVHNAYDGYRPYYKLSAHDVAGTELYVSARTGEVLQRTRRVERAWNYIGAVAHWINPTFLRKNYSSWREVIWILSLSGAILASAGIFLGLLRYVNLKRQQRPGLSPFRGLLRWHHSIGLFAGVLVLSWVLTGWLGLDGIVFFSNDQPTVEQLQRMRGISLTDAAGAFPVAMLGRLGAARQIEFTTVAARPLLLVHDQAGASSRVVSSDPGIGSLRTDAVISDALLTSAVRRAWLPLNVLRVEHIDSGDAYSLRVRPFPPRGGFRA